jgi:2'-5' RNA ligase
VRLFIAIELTEQVRRHLDSLMTALTRSGEGGELPTVSWMKRENWHITLKFLGEVEEARVPHLQQALTSVPLEPIHLCIDRMLYFPKRGPVHVIAAGVGGDVGRLNQLQESIERSCGQLGFAAEDRQYAGHVTFGRSRAGERGGDGVSLRETKLESMFPGPMFQVTQFALVQSRLSNQGSEYAVLQRFE